MVLHYILKSTYPNRPELSTEYVQIQTYYFNLLQYHKCTDLLCHKTNHMGNIQLSITRSRPEAIQTFANRNFYPL